MKPNKYFATGSLLKTYLRSNTVLTLLLVFLPFLLAYGAAVSNTAVLKTPVELNKYISENQGNLLLGSIGAASIAAATIWRIRISAAVILGIISVIIAIDTTRRDEDLGKLELLRAGAVGFRSPLVATCVKVFGVNLLGGISMTLGFAAVAFPFAGSLVAGMSTALCSCFFAVCALVAAQLSPNAGDARGLSFGAMAFFVFLLIIANTLKNEFLLLFTPFGWCAYAKPYAGENYLFFLFPVGIIALFTVIAFMLYEKRDMGAGYFREGKARRSAAKSLCNPIALAWRLQRKMLFTWFFAYALMGLVIGSLAPSINEMLAETSFLPELSAIMGGAGSAFLAILSYILTQVVAAYAIMAVMRIREEESLTRTETVLSTPVTRIRYVIPHLVIAFLGSALCIAAFGLCSGEFATTAARIPAMWIVAAIPVLVYGFLPRAAMPCGWAIFGGLLALEFLWEMRFIGNDIFRFTPFANVYPGVAVSSATMLIMTLIAAMLVGIGLWGYSRRDIVAQ